MLEALETGRRVVGAKEVRRAITGGRALQVFLAGDADPALTQPIALLAQEAGLPLVTDVTRSQLGAVCGIAVGAVAAAVVKG